jgi:hypothetical protein
MRLPIMLFSAIAALSCASAADNLIQNGGFENGSLDHWSSNQQTGGKIKLFNLTNKSKSGTFAVRCNGDQKNRFNGFITFVQPVTAKVIQGKQYQLQGFANADVKSPNGKSLAIAIRQVNAKGGSVKYTRIPVNLNKKGWQLCMKQFQPDKKTVKFQVYIIASKLTSEDKVFIDDLSFKLLDSSAKKFNPEKTVKTDKKLTLKDNNLTLYLDRQTGLLCGLSAPNQVIHPSAKNVTCVYVEKDGKEILFASSKKSIDSNNQYVNANLSANTKDAPFKAAVDYAVNNNIISEKVTFTATQDINYPIKLGVRHGINTNNWKKIFCAMRPLRIIPGSDSTIFSYSSRPEDLNLTRLDQFQRTVYPFVIMENKDYFLFAGTRSLDRFVTVSPNHPEGYVPSVQQNPKQVKKGQKFVFELNWKLFPKKTNLLRDVWRWYSENVYSNNPLINNFVPYKPHQFRTFFPGCFASATYFKKDREARLFPGSNIWWYAWHDWISESYPTKGSWWTQGNSWRFKMTAERVKADTERLQKNGHKLIFYLRQLANLRQKGKEQPDNWYKRTAGGSLDLYGGGYEVKLPANVAKDVGYNSIPWGTYDFDNPEYRKHYLKAIKAVVKFYKPKSIGWDMGWHPNHMGMFAVQAEMYNWLKQNHPGMKVVSNESSGPTQFYSDMVLLENGLLGGKSRYDFEVAKGQNTTMVCLERWNLFRLAVKSNLTGRKTWLSAKGLKANKKYLDYLLKKRPELKSDIIEAARLCQLRMCLYDLAFGASPGYMEEIKPVPQALVKMAGDSNGLPLVTKSFMVKLPSGKDTYNDLASSVWASGKNFRAIIYNDSPNASETTLRLNKKYFEKLGWNNKTLLNSTQYTVTSEKQIAGKPFSLSSDSNDLIFKGSLPAFAAVMIFKDK